MIGHARNHYLSLPRLLDTIADLSLFALLVLAPLAMGGRHPLGRFLFVSLICVMSLASVWHRFVSRQHGWRLTGLEWLLIAAVSVILLQLVPLPASWLATVSPAISERLPLWNAAGSANLGLGTWSSISLHPDATRGGLAMFVAYALLFLVVAQRTTDPHAVRRTLRTVATGAVFMAVVGLIQFLAGTEKFLGVYTHPTRLACGVVKGTFSNQNHMAHLLALGIGPLVWWLSCSQPAAEGSARLRHRDIANRIGIAPWRRALLGTGLGLVLLAGLLTFSRAGVLAMVLATAVIGGVLAWTKALNRRGLAVAGLVVVILAIALTIHGHDALTTRVARLVGARSLAEVSAGRQVIWSAVEKVVSEFPVLGAGVGTHRDVYPMYLDQYAAVEFTHAESGYLQVLEELGVVGLSLLLVAIGVVGNWCRVALLHARDTQMRILAGAVTASLLVSALHSVVDFVWYIPACMTVTVVLAACAWRLNMLGSNVAPDREVLWVSRPLFLAGALGTSVVAMVVITLNLAPARAARDWDQFIRLADQCPETQFPEDAYSGTSGAGARPADSTSPDMVLSRTSAEQEVLTNINRMIAHVSRILAVNPRDARAHSRMAALCLQRFDILQRDAANAMSLTEIRDAALESEFPSLTAQNQWLDRAVAENRSLLDKSLHHARQAARLSPLQGEPYVYLAQLGFLGGDGHRAKWAYLEQALQVRPFSDDVLMATGGELALAGDLQQATVYWRRVFHHSPVYQEQIIAMFAPQVSADTFCKTFQPGLMGAKRLFNYYRKIGFVPQAKRAGQYYVAQVHALARENPDGLDADQWLALSAVQDYLGDDGAVLGSLRNALAQAPTRYKVHHKLARQLLRQRHYEEARQHLQWCLRRKPSDAALQRDLQIATRMEIAPMRR